MLYLSLHDAANNCLNQNATAHIYLTSGSILSGKLEKPNGTFASNKTIHLKHDDGGWSTILLEQVIAVRLAPNL